MVSNCYLPSLTQDFFLSLLADEMAEVRSAAASQIKGVAVGLMGVQDPPTPTATEAPAAAPDALDGEKKAKEGTAADAPMETPAEQVETSGEQQATATPTEDSFIVQRLLPALADLNADSNVHVKSRLGLAVLDLAPLLGKQLTLQHLLPIILSQLKDESPDVSWFPLSALTNS